MKPFMLCLYLHSLGNPQPPRKYEHKQLHLFLQHSLHVSTSKNLAGPYK